MSIVARQLNAALARLLFDGRHAGKPLYLDIDTDLLNAAGALVGINGEEFAYQTALEAGKILAADDAQNALYRYARNAQRWLRKQSGEPPEFIFLLAVFSMAADKMQGDAEFSANNYYERLFGLTGISDATAKNRARRSFQATRFLWEALNEWLRRHDGALGLPTASPVIPSWTYAGYPVSQALVRKAERQRLERMFEAFALTPGEAVQPDEMLDYLAEWIPSTESGGLLKLLWSRQELRQKIAQTASLELASWEGGGSTSTEGGRHQNVTLYLQFGGWIREELHILFGVASGTQCPAGSDGEELRFKPFPSPFEGVDFLESSQPLHLSQILAGGFTIGAGNVQQLLRRSRPVIPFAAASNGPGFRESSRISLITEHAVLCHNQWARQVETHLHDYALRGWIKQDASQLDGLPEDWVVFRNVEFLSAPEANVPNSMQCLVPLADSSLRIEKGLHLAGDDWHSDTGISLKGSASGCLLEIQIFDPLSERVPLVSGKPFSLVAGLDAGRQDGLKAGNLEARLLVDRKTVRTLRFGLRSASKPRPAWSLDDIPKISYGSLRSAPLASLCAVGKEATGYALGLQVTGESDFRIPALSLAGLPKSGVEGTAEAEIAGMNMSLGAANGLEHSCALRGHHVWYCQPFNKGDEARDPKWQTCDGCKTTIVLKNRGRIKRPVRKRRAAYAQRSTPVVRQPALPPRPAEPMGTARLSPNLLLDGLFYLGGGRGSRLSKICAQAGPSVWDGQDFLKNIVALGHIDALPYGHSDQTAYWRTAPAVLCEIRSGYGFLSGFRSADLVAKVVAAAASHGIGVSSAAQVLAPDAIFLTAPNGSSLSALSDSLAQTAGVQFSVQDQTSTRLAALSPPLSTVLVALPNAFPDPVSGLERFNPATASWETAQDVIGGHAYRTAGYLRQYYYVTSDGRAVSAPYAIAKTLAAQSAGVWLHAYADREFSAALGCRPPVLLERALVACSGLAPERRGGRLIYRDVDEITAGLVLGRLYG